MIIVVVSALYVLTLFPPFAVGQLVTFTENKGYSYTGTGSYKKINCIIPDSLDWIIACAGHGLVRLNLGTRQNEPFVGDPRTPGYNDSQAELARFNRISDGVQINASMIIVSDRCNNCLRTTDANRETNSIPADCSRQSNGSHAFPSPQALLLVNSSILYVSVSSSSIQQLNLDTLKISLLAFSGYLSKASSLLCRSPECPSIFATTDSGLVQIGKSSNNVDMINSRKSYVQVITGTQNLDNLLAVPNTADTFLATLQSPNPNDVGTKSTVMHFNSTMKPVSLVFVIRKVRTMNFVNTTLLLIAISGVGLTAYDVSVSDLEQENPSRTLPLVGIIGGPILGVILLGIVIAACIRRANGRMTRKAQDHSVNSPNSNTQNNFPLPSLSDSPMLKREVSFLDPQCMIPRPVRQLKNMRDARDGLSTCTRNLDSYASRKPGDVYGITQEIAAAGQMLNDGKTYDHQTFDVTKLYDAVKPAGMGKLSVSSSCEDFVV